MALAFAKTPALFKLILLLCFRIIKGSVQQINAVYWWGEPELRGDIQGTFNSSPLKSCDQTVTKRNNKTLGVLWNPVGWMKSMEFKGWKKRKNKRLKPGSTWENWGWLHILQNNGQKSELSRVTQWKKVLWFMIHGEVVIPLSHLCVCCALFLQCHPHCWWREDCCCLEYSNLHQLLFILNQLSLCLCD